MAEKTIGLRLQIDGVNQTISTIKDLETAIGKMREKLATVAIGSQDFKRLTSEVQRAETEVGKLRQQTEGIGFEKQLEGFGKFTGGITAGFAAATAAAQLFGEDSEDVSKAAATAQNLLTVAIGARGIAETIAGAKILATTIATKAQTIATNIANLSLKSLYATMVANPIGAVLAVVGLLVTAMIALSDSTKKQITVQDQINKAMTVSATKTAEQTTKLNALLKVVNDTTKSEQARNGALNELKKLLPGINTLTLKNANANDILSKSVDNYVKKQEKLIQLEQLRDLLKQKGEKLNELNNKTIEDEISLTDRLLNFNNLYGAEIRANTRLTEERQKAQKEYNSVLSQYSELVRQTTEDEVEANQIEADRLKAIEDSKKAYDASIANQRRRNELIQSELQKNLANLELAYREEVKAAKEKGENVALVEQVFLKNRAKLFEDYKKEFVRIQTETYTELNRLTNGSYLVEEASLKRTQKAQREELEKFYNDLLVIAEQERTKTSAAVTNQSKEVVAAKKKEINAMTELTQQRGQLEATIEQGRTQAIQDNAKKQLQILEKSYDDATKARIAAEEKFTQVQKQQAGVNTKQIEEEKERIRKEFRETQAQQELLFEAQLNTQRKQVILDGAKAINDILNMEDEDRLNYSKEIFNEEFNLFVEAEKRKIRAAIESKAIIQKNGQEFTQEEKDALEEQVQAALKNYDAIAEGVRKNKLKEIEYSKQVIAFDKESLNQRLESEQTFTEQLLTLKSELIGEESVKKREKIQKKIELLEAKHGAELLKIEAENQIKKLEILSKDPTLSEEEQKRIQLSILDLRKQYADKQIAIDKLVKEMAIKDSDFFYKELSKGQVDALAKLGFAAEQFSKLLSGFASTSAQSFQIQLEALELLNTETLSRIAEEGARIQGESEADYEIRKKRTDQKREEQEKIFAANKKKIEKEARLSSLKFQIAQTIADTAAATIKTFAQFGFSPAAFIANGIGAVIAVAQIAEISKQIGVVNSMARGGFLRGPSHEQGGIKYQGGGVELEGNEAIINRRSTLQYAGLLSQINEQGGGKPIYVNSIMDSRMAEVLASTRNEPIRAYVLEQDITKSQAVNRRLEELASF